MIDPLEAMERLYETGSVLAKKKDTGRQRYARNVWNVETILGAVEQEPEINIRDIARQHVFHRTTNLEERKTARLLLQQRATPMIRRLSSEEEVLREFSQKSKQRSRISFLSNIQWCITVYTRRSFKLAQYVRMGKSASDAAQKFPSSLELERLGWD